MTRSTPSPLVRGCLTLAMALAANQAAAQIAEGDVVMRRPLPVKPSVSSSQNDCMINGSCPPPVEDGGSGEVPPPSQADGFDFNPELTQPADYSPEWGPVRWTTTPWVGTGQCGEQGSYTRQIGCEKLVMNGDPGGGGGGPVMSGLPSDKGVRSVSSTDSQTANMSHALFDPANPNVKLQKAQFSPDMIAYIVPASVEQCSAEAGPPPPNVYNGKQAGCNYVPVEQGKSSWEVMFEWENPACSPYAYRTTNYTCSGPDGSPADLQYCLENVRQGGTRNNFITDVEFGNTTGCQVGWVGIATNNYCIDPNTWQSQKNHYASYNYQCVRSDGNIVDEAQCGGKERPEDKSVVVGQCESVFYMSGFNYYCEAGPQGLNVLGKWSFTDMNEATRSANGLCKSVDASCCSLRQVNNSEYLDAPSGTYQVIATGGEYSFTPDGFYVDEFDRGRPPNGIPFFWNRGGRAEWRTVLGYIPNDDPDNVLNGMSVNPGYGGGGPS